MPPVRAGRAVDTSNAMAGFRRADSLTLASEFAALLGWAAGKEMAVNSMAATGR